MTTNTIDTNNQSNTGVSFIDYLKKCLREMPISACREMVGVHRVRLQQRIADMEKIVDAPEAELVGMQNVVNAMSDFQKVVDAIIEKYGEDVPMSVNPDYDDDAAANAFLWAIGW